MSTIHFGRWPKGSAWMARRLLSLMETVVMEAARVVGWVFAQSGGVWFTLGG